jgi:hypothetical protein
MAKLKKQKFVVTLTLTVEDNEMEWEYWKPAKKSEVASLIKNRLIFHDVGEYNYVSKVSSVKVDLD